MKKKNFLYFKDLLSKIEKRPKTWLITGVAGFIGSNLLEFLLSKNQKVIGIDNFISGHKKNLINVKLSIDSEKWKNFKFIKLDISDLSNCHKALNKKKIDYVLHQAALGSVPRSIKNPVNTHNQNVNGFINMLIISKKLKVKNFVYASSSSVYGDHKSLPKVEEKIGNLLSPYAATKYINELYADIFWRIYKFKSIGLRYFNVFGKRQDPNGSYAAVIPKWINLIINNKKIKIYGTGKTSRDFCYIDNVIKANILSALNNRILEHKVFNIAAGQKTSLNKLFLIIKKIICKNYKKYSLDPLKKNFRKGDIMHSHANIDKAKKFLAYKPDYFINEGIRRTIDWYMSDLKKNDK